MGQYTLSLAHRVAFHEAGHAVAAYLSGYRIRTVSIVPAQGVLGRVALDRRPGRNTADRVRFWFAGLAAEMLLLTSPGGWFAEAADDFVGAGDDLCLIERCTGRPATESFGLFRECQGVCEHTGAPWKPSRGGSCATESLPDVRFGESSGEPSSGSEADDEQIGPAPARRPRKNRGTGRIDRIHRIWGPRGKSGSPAA